MKGLPAPQDLSSEDGSRGPNPDNCQGTRADGSSSIVAVTSTESALSILYFEVGVRIHATE
jgi:hypothetical protein